MILGVDHLSLSVAELKESHDYLIRSGWRQAFSEKGLSNSSQKRPLLHHYQTKHDIALYRPITAGVALEATSHGAIDHKTTAAFQPLLSGPLDEIQIREPDEHESRQLSLFEQLGMQNVTPIHWLPFSVDAWHSQDCDNNMVILSVAKLEKECRFWQQALGWSIVQEFSQGTRLRLNSPVKSWCCDLVITENESCSEYTLDAQGFPCLAMYTNALNDDLQHASQCGAELITEPFILHVDGKTLNIALLRTPGMAICELIQVVTQKG